MKKLIICIFFLIISELCYGQNFRDYFLGQYNGILTQYTITGSNAFNDFIIVSTSPIDTNVIHIEDSSGNINYDYYIYYSDSTFEHIFVPNQRYGFFYDMDSVFLYDYMTPQSHEIFLGKKFTAGENEIYNNTFSIYPNPAKDKIYITLKNPKAKLEIKLFNSIGKVIFERTFQNSDKILRIDLPELADGIYFLNLRSEKYNMTGKVFIQK